MKTKIILTGILRDNDLFLIVKRNENDELYPGHGNFQVDIWRMVKL